MKRALALIQKHIKGTISMIRINCPHCGKREHAEFTYGEDASRLLPANDASLETWNEYVFERDNVAGEHLEYWHHALGCRSWLKVQRNTLTHDISWVGFPHDTPPAQGEVKS